VVLPVREERPVEEALQAVLQERRGIRDRKCRSGAAGDGADVDRLGPRGERFTAKQFYVPPAGLPAKVDEEAAPERRWWHVGNVWDRRGVMAAAGSEDAQDEQPGGAQSHDRRIR
jgi:hypothetical protein